MAEKTKYLSYLEETRKHHGLIEEEAKTAVKKAIEESHNEGVAVTFLEGEKIVKVGPKGKKSEVGTVVNNRRKVKVGDKAKISKK